MASMPSAASGRFTMLLHHSICAVETALRFSGAHEVGRREPSRYDEAFRGLRSEIFKYTDWSTVDPLVYLSPFLAIIKGFDVSGAITAAATVALLRIINSQVLGFVACNAEGAINQIVEDTTEANFESSTIAQDEIILLNIVQVLSQTMFSPAGPLLSDVSICKAFQTTFMLCNPLTSPKYGPLIGYYSRQVCTQMIETVFGRLCEVARYERALEAQASGTSTAPLPPPPARKHGVQGAADIFDFLIELIRKDPAMEQEHTEETIVFALDMVQAALVSIGSDLLHFQVLVFQVQVELLHAICQAAVNFTSVPIINGFCQALLCIYTFMGTNSICQIEMVMDRVLLKLADGKSMNSLEQQAAALEGVLDLCRQPGFVHDIFVNCDCRLERIDLFSDMCTLLSKTAMPGAKGAVGPLQFISLEALLAILNAIAAESHSNALQPPLAELELPIFFDIWTSMVKGKNLDLTLLVEAGSVGVISPPSSRGPPSNHSPLPLTKHLSDLQSVVYERHLKHKLSTAVQTFNKSHKKGLRYLQDKKLMPILAGSVLASSAAASDVRNEDELAVCLGRYLHACPGLSKVVIGELLGEGDAFYIQVLEAYTTSFVFTELKFDAAIRIFLESFRLPGEAQKIDRIINSFGRHFYAHNASAFKSSDAAYILAYSVIMLNTDRHNNQVKNKMSLEAFRRNLRGVNEKTDFPEDFLNDIYYSIIKTPLRMNELNSMDLSEQTFAELQRLSATQRGQLLRSKGGHHLFDTTMFRLMWNPAITSICAIIDHVSNEVLVDSALDGLEVAAHIAACHQLDDVSDSIIINLSKIPQQVSHVAPNRPESVFGRDARMRSVTLAIANIANHHGDSIEVGWTNVMELIVCFYKQEMLPDCFSQALSGDEGGGLVPKGTQMVGLKERRYLAKSTYLRQPSSMSVLPLPETESLERYSSPAQRVLASISEETLVKCSWEYIFVESKLLKQESLVNLVEATIWASGPIPRGATGAAVVAAAGWDVSELCLELLYTLLLRNRDRMAVLWPRIYDHFQKIFSFSREVDPALVQKGVLAMLRLSTRLLPYKPDTTEPLMKGIQLLSLIDSQVASDMAPTIAEEVMGLLKGAAPFIQHQPVWKCLSGLLRVVQHDEVAFPLCVETVAWVVKQSLAPMNFSLMLQLVVELLERAESPFEICRASRSTKSIDVRLDQGKGQATGNVSTLLGLLSQATNSKPVLLGLLTSCMEWLEVWWLDALKSSRIESNHAAFKSEAWYQVVGALCTAMKSGGSNCSSELCSVCGSCLQRAMVAAAEKLAVPCEMVQQALLKLLLPTVMELAKLVSIKGGPQAELTVQELLRAVAKGVFLYADQLQQLSSFGALWRQILTVMVAVMGAAVGAGSGALAEAVPEVLKSMLVQLSANGCLKFGWTDTDGADLYELTWQLAATISAGLTPAHFEA